MPRTENFWDKEVDLKGGLLIMVVFFIILLILVIIAWLRGDIAYIISEVTKNPDIPHK